MIDQRQWGYDDVCGVVIGGAYVPWCVAYDEVPKSGKDYADNEDAAIEAGKALIAKIRAECCGHPLYLYPDDKWTVRIYHD